MSDKRDMFSAMYAAMSPQLIAVDAVIEGFRSLLVTLAAKEMIGREDVTGITGAMFDEISRRELAHQFPGGGDEARAAVGRMQAALMLQFQTGVPDLLPLQRPHDADD